MKKNPVKIRFYLYNFFLFRLPVVRACINLFSDLIHMTVCLFTKRSGITGRKRLVAGISCLLRKKNTEELHITNKGIYRDGKCVDRANYPVTDFIPAAGIRLKKNDLTSVEEIIQKNLPGAGSDIVKSYLKAKGWFIFSMCIYIFVNVFVLFQIAVSYNRYYLSVRRVQFIHDLVWYITNLFFLFQLYIYFKVSVKGVSLRHSLRESGFSEESSFQVDSFQEDSFQFRGQQPGAIILIPAYMEEPLLLKRVLISLFLQTYGEKRIVVLLDDDTEFDTRPTIGMIEELKEGLLSMCKRIKEKESFFISNSSDPGILKRNCGLLGEFYCLIHQWIIALRQDIEDSHTYFPVDDFFLNEVVRERETYFQKTSQVFTQAIQDDESFPFSESFYSRMENAFLECKRFFDFTLELFMRSDYTNVSHERTKSANLNTYCRLINKKWTSHEEPGKGKRTISILGESDEHDSYVAILDADVIVKPDYLIRKIIFLEKKENSACGLIQSPYHVPADEKNRVAEATGVHNDWFFPYSLGLNYYNSVFWLGYNGVFRYEVLKDKDFFVAKTVVEDIEISLKIRQKNYHIVTSHEEQCITFSPTDLNALEVQRKRWASGCLRIARIFLNGLAQKRYPGVCFKEIFFRFIYILNLNLLPVFSTLLYFTILSVSKDFMVFLILPWAVYILCLFNLERIRKRRRISQVIDSILIYFYMNSFHLKGLARSVRNLFIKERIFYTTPKTSGYRKNAAPSGGEKVRLRYFELFEILFITAFYIIMSVENILKGYFYLQVFPVYYIVITYAGLARLVGIKHFFYCLYYRFFLAPLRYCIRLFKRGKK